MKRGLSKRLIGILILTAGYSLSLAQNQGDFLQNYRQAMQDLTESVTALPSDSASALQNIDRASAMLRTLVEDSTSNSLIRAMDRIFERARTAIENQSQTDLAVQTAVLAGGFQRLVLDAALGAAGEEDLTAARERLELIASDMELDQDVRAALNDDSLSAAALRLQFELGVAQNIRQRLRSVGRSAASNQDGAYQALAVAYGRSLSIQDSPRTPRELNETFVDTFTTLVNGQADILSTQLQALDQQLAQLAEASRQELIIALQEEVAPATPEAEASPSTPAPSPPATTTAAAATSGEVLTAALPPQTTESQETTSPEAATPTPSEAATTTTPATPQSAPVTPETLAKLEGLAAELDALGIDPATRSRLAVQMTENGYQGIDDVIDRLYTLSARILVAVEAGEQDLARELIGNFAVIYEKYLSPIVSLRDPAADASTARLTRSLSTSLVLRLQDVTVLGRQVDTLNALLIDNQHQRGSQRALVDTTLLWGGTIRLVLVILIGLLAFIPLYLLNLAFGDGNRHWQLVGVSLFLLLLPIIFESLSFIGSLLANLTGLQALGVLSTLSIFQNTISQAAWVVVTAVAIGFAIVGLYGICVQFGLLGGGLGSPQMAAAGDARTSVTSSNITSDTLVDWDEEF